MTNGTKNLYYLIKKWHKSKCHGIINVLPIGHGRAGGRLESLACSFNCFVVIQYITDMYMIATTLNSTFNIMIITKTVLSRLRFRLAMPSCGKTHLKKFPTLTLVMDDHDHLWSFQTLKSGLGSCWTETSSQFDINMDFTPSSSMVYQGFLVWATG